MSFKIKAKSVNNADLSKRRTAWMFLIIGIVFIVLVVRLAKLQVIDGEEYTTKATSMQTRDTVISSSRGNIYDRNGTILATTSECFSLWARPTDITWAMEEGRIRYADVKSMADTLAEICGLEADKTLETLLSEERYICLAKYLNKEQYLAIFDEAYTGISLNKDTKRYYPLGNFASQVLGSVNDDGNGRSGIEYQYNDFLTGQAGRWVKKTDSAGNELVGGEIEYYPAENGGNLIMTLDQAIQYYAEQACERALEKHNAKRVMCIVTDPQSGEILASAVTGGFNPNFPTEPDNEKDLEKYNALESVEDKSAFLFSMWRNPLVSDTYEPGSTFKTIIASMALEEQKVNKTEDFYCGSSVKIYDWVLHCSENRAHGHQTLKQAVGNSCNVAFAKIAGILGANTVKKYLELFGFTSTTGVDYPGEASAIIQNLGPVELATVGFGQGIAVTPIQLITAVNAIANGGTLIKPHYVKELVSYDGKTVQTIEPEIIRQVISEETSKDLREIMQYVVDEAGGRTAKIQGYAIAGKTGTANKVDETSTDGYGEYFVSSFVGFAPADDPQISILVIMDSSSDETFGSLVAAPVAKEILTDVLRYLDIDGTDTGHTNASEYVKVPNITGKSFDEAVKILNSNGLNYSLADSSESTDFTVVDQYPKKNTKVGKGSTVYIYKN